MDLKLNLIVDFYHLIVDFYQFIHLLPLQLVFTLTFFLDVVSQLLRHISGLYATRYQMSVCDDGKGVAWKSFKCILVEYISKCFCSSWYDHSVYELLGGDWFWCGWSYIWRKWDYARTSDDWRLCRGSLGRLESASSSA